jgi:hypothetical protein
MTRISALEELTEVTTWVFVLEEGRQRFRFGGLLGFAEGLTPEGVSYR